MQLIDVVRGSPPKNWVKDLRRTGGCLYGNPLNIPTYPSANYASTI